MLVGINIGENLQTFSNQQNSIYWPLCKPFSVMQVMQCLAYKIIFAKAVIIDKSKLIFKKLINRQPIKYINLTLVYICIETKELLWRLIHV